MASDVTATLSRFARSSAVRFLVVGVLSFVADLGALYVLHGLLGIWLPLATTLAYAIAFVVNFGLNRVWAFQATGAVTRQVRLYLYLVAANVLVTVALVQGLTWLGMPYLGAKTCTAVVLAVANYVISRKWIFL